MNVDTESVNSTLIDAHKLGDIMSKTVLTVYEGWSVKRLAGFFVKHDISGAPVIAADDELVGVVTLSDVVRFDSRERTDSEMENLVWLYTGMAKGVLSASDLQHLKDKASETCTVYSIMTPEVISVDIESPVSRVCSKLIDSDINRLFVTQDNRLVGTVTSIDILRALVGK